MASKRLRPTLPTVLPAMLLLAACAGAPDRGPDAESGSATRTVEGTIVSIDTAPWAYDGNAVVVLEDAAGRHVQVQLPARWNLCAAAPVDVAALAVGMRAKASGSADGEGGLVVCQQTSDHLAPLASP